MSSEGDPVAQASLLLRQGDATAARARFRQLSGQLPGRVDVWAGLAMASGQLGDFDDACAAIDRALALPPPQPGLWLLAAHLYQDAGRIHGALERAERVPPDHPAYAKARNQMAILLADLQRLDEAEVAGRQAVAADPSMVRAVGNLAAIRLKQGDASDAMRWASEATRLQHDYLHGYVVAAMAALQLGDQVNAVKALDTALTINPDHVDCLLMRASIDRQQQAIDQAADRVGRALALAPNRIDAICQMADVMFLAGDHEGARAQWGRALELQPAHLEAALRRVQALPMVYAYANAIDAVRERYAAELQALRSKAETVDGTAIEIMRQITVSNFFLAYQGRDDLKLQKIYADFLSSILRRICPDLFVERPRRGALDRRIRIGFASRFFYESTAGNYFQSWITGLDRSRFEVFVYYTHSYHDRLTERIGAAADHFAAYRPDVNAWATRIADDQLDILVYPEVGMDAVCATLAAFRLAPAQVAGWGHPVTTGHANIDYFLSCGEMEPEQGASHYSERLVTLPGLGTRYALPKLDESFKRRDRVHYGLPEDATLYLVPQSLFKIHPDNDALFAAVLAADRDTRLVFFAGRAARVQELFKSRVEAALVAAGVSLERVLFLPDVAHPDYLRINQLCDVMLDTLHWSGGNTSLDALSVGLPIVTLPGAYMRGRQSMAMLRRLGVLELIAGNADEYVDKAVALGRDPAHRKAISQRIVDNHRQLFDDAAPLHALQDFFCRVAAADPEPPAHSLQ